MSDYLIEIEELLDQASALEPGPAKVALVEEAVRLADAHGDVEEGFRTRDELITEAMMIGNPDVEMVAFSWCLSQCDRDPEKFPDSKILWKYKWIMDALPEYPQITRQQIDEMLADMTRRYQRAGSTLHAVMTLRRDLAVDMGDREAAEAAHRETERTRRDHLSDCPACVTNGTVLYLAFMGRHRETLERAEPILSGKQRCSHVPQATYAHVLLSLLHERRVEEAMGYHLKGYKVNARNPGFVSRIAKHLRFLSLTDNLPRTVRMLERHLPDAVRATALARQFLFYLATLVLLDRLMEQGKTELRLRLPAEVASPDSRGRYSLPELSQWFGQRASELADRFDARNGNNHHHRQLAELKELGKLVQPYAVPGRKWNENTEE